MALVQLALLTKSTLVTANLNPTEEGSARIKTCK